MGLPPSKWDKSKESDKADSKKGQSCPSCGTEIPDNLKFCTDCGVPLPKKKSTAAEVGEGLAWIAVGVAVLLGILVLWVFYLLFTTRAML